MLRLKASTIITHAAGWIIFFLLPFLLFPTPQGNENVGGIINENVIRIMLSVNYWLSYALYIFLFYFNGHFLIPKFYLRKKYLIYFSITLLLFVSAYYVRQSIQQPPVRVFSAAEIRRVDSLIRNRALPFQQMDAPMRNQPPTNIDLFIRNRMPPPRPGFNPANSLLFRPPPGADIFAILLLGTIWALSTAVRTARQWSKTEQRAVRAEADKVNAELSFLKAQINPHFLFNILNNIYSLAVKKNENTATSIMKLSNIMRYVTDEAACGLVPLYYEINCIRDYIDLQQQRLSKTATVNFCVTGDPEGHNIPPLILMTFV